MAFLVIAFCSCNENKTEKTVITVSIEPLRYFVGQIAGDRAEVVSLVPKGCSPETYEPTAKQLVDLSKSVLFVKIGDLGFEKTWMKKLDSFSSHITIINSSEGIRTVETSTKGVTDQHTWMSTQNALIIAKNIYEALIKVDKQSEVYYKQRYDSLVAHIAATDDEISQKVKATTTRSFIIYHPALTYFARDYGFTQFALEEDGREPSAASLASLITKAKEAGTKLMFVQKEFDNRNKEIILLETNVQTIDINPLDYDWTKQMTNIADALASQDTLSVKQHASIEK